jgi:cytosine/adenosine deaminase-related metal-dependent hydrolase
MGILTSLDGDGLARYLIAEHNYLRATKHLFEALAAGTTAEADKWSSIQDRFFRQCRSAGADLGLTVSGRCSLELPPSQVEEASREEAELFGD